ncbi:MAG: type I restriction enzyme S subunit [Candidatus Endobugula sp.]|jgi:type I restriction enzyme S subunit
MIDIESTKDFSINKSDWKKVEFGDVVFEPKESVKNSVAEGIEHVVGLEHINSEDIHLRRSNSIEKSTTFTKKFCKGDLLFGRRRAYLKKAAKADFEGVCSGDITVMRANDGLLPELLPFIVNNDEFFDYAVTHSAGGLSPRVKFKDLAHYELVIPPLAAQGKVVQLLQSLDEVIQREKLLLDELIRFKHCFRKEVFNGFDKRNLKYNSVLIGKPDWKVCALGDVCKITNNLRKPISKEVRSGMKGNYPYYGPTSVLDYISEFRLDGEYVLIGEDGDHFLKYEDWNMTQYVEGKFNVNNHAHILKGTDFCLTKWIFFSLQHRNVIPHISKQGATRYKLNKDSLEKIPLIVPPVHVQRSLIEKFELIEKNIKKVKAKISESIKFNKIALKQVF